MRVLFLSISSVISDINNRGVYPDLIRYFLSKGHEIVVVSPFERRTKKQTRIISSDKLTILGIRTLNITKTNLIEKGIATILIQYQFKQAIKHHFINSQFDLILYSTPPITFNSLVKYLKLTFRAQSILMLKDIFPQNAVDIGLISAKGFFHKYFRNIEKQLYNISDLIGCMSSANLEYILKNNPQIDYKKLFICPNAIDIKIRNSSNNNEVRSKYKIPTDSTLLLFSGNLGKPQCIHLLLGVLDNFLNRNDCYFLIIGSGTESSRIINWIFKNKPNNVNYIKMLDRIEFEKIEECCDVGLIFLDFRFTIPNFPSRLLSYLECKLPLVLATDTATDLRQIALENGFGKWSSSNNVDQIVQNIEFMIQNPVIRKKMGENGYNYLLKNYNVSMAYNAILSNITSY
jgi:glycosyltransferase involved in cell wall biosynthesis